MVERHVCVCVCVYIYRGVFQHKETRRRGEEKKWETGGWGFTDEKDNYSRK